MHDTVLQMNFKMHLLLLPYDFPQMIRSMVKLKSRIDAALVLAQGTLFPGQKAKNSMSIRMMHKVKDFFKIRTQASYTNCDKLKQKMANPFKIPIITINGNRTPSKANSRF